MLVNTGITHFHKTIDESSRLERWEKYNYGQAWWFGTEGATVNKGYDNSNQVNVRIWYNSNQDLKIEKFKVGDIIVKGNVDVNITSQQDLIGYEFCNITGINDNNFGNSPHIHVKGQ